jgi:hypothetical protein
VLESTNFVVLGVVFVGLSVLVSLLALWLVRWLVPNHRLTPHNEVSGFVYAVIGVIYAVIIAFVVISVWERYSAAEDNAHHEAEAVGNLFRLAEGLPEPARQAIQGAALDYAAVVVEEEWPLLREGRRPSETALAHMDALWLAVYGVDVATPGQEALYAAALDELDDLSSFRLARLMEAEAGVLGIMWAVMIAGGILIVLFPCQFGVESGLVHALIIATLAATIGLLLLTVYEMNHPFRGTVRVAPDGFELVLDQFGDGSP